MYCTRVDTSGFVLGVCWRGGGLPNFTQHLSMRWGLWALSCEFRIPHTIDSFLLQYFVGFLGFLGSSSTNGSLMQEFQSLLLMCYGHLFVFFCVVSPLRHRDRIQYDGCANMQCLETASSCWFLLTSQASHRRQFSPQTRPQKRFPGLPLRCEHNWLYYLFNDPQRHQVLDRFPTSRHPQKVRLGSCSIERLRHRLPLNNRNTALT